MLSLTRYPDQRIVITHESSGDQLTINVAEVNPRNLQVRLGFVADRCFLIDREEIWRKKQQGESVEERMPISEGTTRGNVKSYKTEPRPSRPPPAPTSNKK